MNCIIKRKSGVEEKFDERKVFASVYSSCLNVDIERHKAEKISSKVSKDIKTWIKNRKSISSNTLFKEVIKSLRKYNHEAAFMYETHRDIG